MDVMVDNDGISGNVAYSMTDKQKEYHESIKYKIWLQDVGLWETRRIISND